jgi:hypothetical protein
MSISLHIALAAETHLAEVIVVVVVVVVVVVAVIIIIICQFVT